MGCCWSRPDSSNKYVRFGSRRQHDDASILRGYESDSDEEFAWKDGEDGASRFLLDGDDDEDGGDRSIEVNGVLYKSIGELKDRAFDHMLKKQAEAKRDPALRLGDWDRWDIDQTSGKLTFSNNDGGEKLICDFQLVGTYSHLSRSFLWADCNPGLDPSLMSLVSSCRREQGAIPCFATDQVHCEESEADGMAALVGELCPAQTLAYYRCPNGDLGFFWTIITGYKRVAAS